MRTTSIALAVVVCVGCGSSAAVDGGTDARAADAGSDAPAPDLGTDLGPPDLGTDFGPPDLGEDASYLCFADAGSMDAGALDAGDAATGDAGAPDAAATDAGGGAPPTAYHADCDGDGYGSVTQVRHGCTAPTTPPACTGAAGTWSTDGTDCADADPAVHPGASETCDGVDQDCNGTVDDAAAADAWCSAPARTPHATAHCAAGSCAVDSCTAPYLDCTAAAGCETNGDQDLDHCGTCTTVCDGTRCRASACHGDVAALGLGSFHACAVRTDGTVSCWGSSIAGELGDGLGTMSALPVSVTGITDAVAVAGGRSHTCAVHASGAVSCWGNDFDGELGTAPGASSPVPVAVPGISDATAIAAGDTFTCALEASGAVACWGSNTSGTLGDGTTTARSGIVAVSGLADAVEIAAGQSHACARRMTGAVVCWGQNAFGQLGDGTTTDRPTPVTVTGLSGALSVTAGGAHSCSRRAGDIVCWGERVGTTGMMTTTFTPVPTLTTTLVVSAGHSHICAISAIGALYCWGGNADGELGIGTMAASAVPRSVSTITDAVSVVAGGGNDGPDGAFTCAVRAGGGVYCWGWNSRGQLGDGTMTGHALPAPIRDP